MESVFVRNPFNYDTDMASAITGLETTEPSMTQQQFKEETDINTIVERFGITGQLPTNVRMPLYEDFVDVMDFQSAMNAMRAAEESFAAMPAKVRERFHHDPQQFLEFVNDGRNYDEAVKLGLVLKPMEPPKEPAPPAVNG